MLKYLSTLSPVGGAVWGMVMELLGDVALLEEEHHLGAGFVCS